MIPRPPHAVLLDAMGTLVTLDAPAPLLRALLAERLGVAVTEAQAREALAAEVVHYRAHMASGVDAGAVAALRRECAEVLRRALPAGPRLQAADPLVMTQLLVDALRFRAYDDVVPALTRLRAAGLRLVVASNWDASLPEVLGRVGLTELLDGVVSSAPLGAAKPDPLVLGRALELAGAQAADAVHVGDSPREDVAGARAAGIAPVLIERGGERVDRGVATIHSLAQLPALLGI